MTAWRRIVSSLLAAALAGGMALAANAQEKPPEPRRTETAQAAHPLPLPPVAVTKQSIKIGDSTYDFTARVGALAMKDARGNVQAEIGYVAYTLDKTTFKADGADKTIDAEPASRPVTVAMNGGPGASSAYLNLLAIGPWRLPLGGGDAGPGGRSISPSQTVALTDNQESWLPFTDLVFIDPPGTGYSRVLGGEEVRKEFYSVDGDIDILAAAVSRWMRENNRLASPKYFVGESYGGFRGPLLAEKLQTKQGIGFKGLVLISPVLDFAWIFQSDRAAWELAGRLPSFAAANLELEGKPFDEAARKAVEDYASGPYLTDLIRGVRDGQAVARVSEKVAGFTGLDPALVRRMAGRIDMRTFQRERLRDRGKVMSAYDTGILGDDPDPISYWSRFEDPALSAMTAPLTGAMVDLLRNRLGYKADDFQYQLLNGEVNRAWGWRKGRLSEPENLGALARIAALDPNLRVVLVHGATDLVTPYFTNRMLINQLPLLGKRSGSQRDWIDLNVLPGGHMFYDRDDSRKALQNKAHVMMQPRIQAFRFGRGTGF